MNHNARIDDSAIKALDSAIKVLIVTLAIIFIWFGGIKFTAGGASGIEGLVKNSPLLSWALSIFDVGTFAALLGTIEIIIGLLLLAGLANFKLRTIAGIGAIITFLITLTFMLTTPGVVPEGASFPVLSGMPGEFLLKDLVFLAVSYVIFISGRYAFSANHA